MLRFEPRDRLYGPWEDLSDAIPSLTAILNPLASQSSSEVLRDQAWLEALNVSASIALNFIKASRERCGGSVMFENAPCSTLCSMLSDLRYREANLDVRR